jgi:hypothetical protein
MSEIQLEMTTAKTKLSHLANIFKSSINDLLFNATVWADCVGICMNPDCNYTSYTELDQANGFCKKCNTNTVCSCMVLSERILNEDGSK